MSLASCLLIDPYSAVTLDAKIGLNSSEVFSEQMQPTNMQPRKPYKSSVSLVNSIQVSDNAADDATSDGATFERNFSVARSPSYHSRSVYQSVEIGETDKQKKCNVFTDTASNRPMDRNRNSKRRSPGGGIDVESQSNDDIASTTTSFPIEEVSRKLSALHELEKAYDENESTESASLRDVDFEVTLLSLRNRRVLLSRLQEVAPRGKLSMINLCRRGIGVDEALLLRDAIKQNPHLSVLKLCYNNLGDEGTAIIASALLDNNRHHHLSVLDLGFNAIGDIGCGYLAVNCLAGNYNLQSIFLSGNKIGEKGALSIAGAILHGSNLQQIYLSANEIGPVGIKTIAGAIVKNESRNPLIQGQSHSQQYRKIEVLNLGSTSIESTGFFAIPGLLLSNTSLKSLCVADNNLDDKDMLLLSQALTQNKIVPLESLALSFNTITCIGVECLMNALWGSKTLRELKLDNNQIQDRGAQLCAVVLTSIALETLDLSFNNISTAGIKGLMKNVSENNSLQTLGLSGIPIDQNASKAVSYALAYNTSLRSLHVDNCSTGYASQRHIVAGAVSNRKSSLRVLTGFAISPVAMTLGMPRLPEDWSNVQVLGFFRLMWDQWLLKSRQGANGRVDEMFRGPAPPAAVASAAKIAFASLGPATPGKLFRTEQHQKPITERAPVEPAGSALLERSNSGTIRVPLFTVSSEVQLSDFVDGEDKVAVAYNDMPCAQMATVRAPLENTERRNHNLRWLRLHFRALSDIGRLPFNNADLWQLHQYYFSPPQTVLKHDEIPSNDSSPTATFNSLISSGSFSQHRNGCMALERTVSYHTLESAVVSSRALKPELNSHKRRSDDAVEDEEEGHASKRLKNLKPRIAYYPRIMLKVNAMGTRPTSETLSLLRQLKYTESVLFANRDPYSNTREIGSNVPSHSDVDMILLDLL